MICTASVPALGWRGEGAVCDAVSGGSAKQHTSLGRALANAYFQTNKI